MSERDKYRDPCKEKIDGCYSLLDTKKRIIETWKNLMRIYSYDEDMKKEFEEHIEEAEQEIKEIRTVCNKLHGKFRHKEYRKVAEYPDLTYKKDPDE